MYCPATEKQSEKSIHPHFFSLLNCCKSVLVDFDKVRPDFFGTINPLKKNILAFFQIFQKKNLPDIFFVFNFSRTNGAGMNHNDPNDVCNTHIACTNRVFSAVEALE